MVDVAGTKNATDTKLSPQKKMLALFQRLKTFEVCNYPPKEYEVMMNCVKLRIPEEQHHQQKVN